MAILANEKVLTLDYWKPAYQIEVGDYVFNQTGDLVKVTLVQQYHAAHCYKVTFNDHLTVSGDAHLEFPVETRAYRKKLDKYLGVQKFRAQLKPMQVAELKDYPLEDHNRNVTLSVPTAHPLKLPHQPLSIPPYIFGYWFFNKGVHNTMTFSKNRREEIEQQFKDGGYEVITWVKDSKKNLCFKTIPNIVHQLAGNLPVKIPNNYLLASVEQRQQLLSGIMAARGRQYNKTKDRFRVYGKQLRQLTPIQFLVESLGFRTNISYDAYNKMYILVFRSRLKLVPEQVSPPVKVQYGRRYLRLVEEIAPQSCIHIETEGKSNPILVGEGFIACH